MRVVIAVLAHENEACLRDFADSVRRYGAQARLIVYNGGRDANFASGLEFERARYSAPVIWGRGLERFQLGIMRQLYEDQTEFDYLVTLDSDALLIGPLEPWLRSAIGDADYMAAFLRNAPHHSDSLWVQRVYIQWRLWRPFFEGSELMTCYNPGQVFGREYIDRLFRWPLLDALEFELRRSRLNVLEEILWPSLAEVLRVSAVPYQRDAADAMWGQHTTDALSRYQQEGLALCHKIGMQIDSPDRAYLQSVRTMPPHVRPPVSELGGEVPCRSAGPDAWGFDQSLRRRLRSSVGNAILRAQARYRRPAVRHSNRDIGAA